MAWTETILCAVYLQCSLLISCAISETPSAPTNLTLDEIFDSAVIVTWDVDSEDDIGRFEIIIRPLIHPNTPEEVLVDLQGDERSFIVQSLFPSTSYEIYIVSSNTEGRSNRSDILTFRTLEASAQLYTGRLNVNPGEVVVVVLILVAWICAVVLFLHKWGTIRILPSVNTRYNHCPKNLHTIKVVKRSTDSVIYKNYTKEVSTTMIARQKRFERMHTMPNIKINAAAILAEVKNEESAAKDEKLKKQRHKFKVFSRTITSPVLEVEEPASSSKA